MYTEGRITELLRRLQVVASLQPHEKLSVQPCGSISVCTPTALAGPCRFVSGDGRETTVAAVCRTVDELAGQLRMLARLYSRGEVGVEGVLARWTSEMYACWTGLETLKTTYHGDGAAIAHISSVQHSLDRVVDHVELALGRTCVHRDGVTRPSSPDPAEKHRAEIAAGATLATLATGATDTTRAAVSGETRVDRTGAGTTVTTVSESPREG